MPYGAIKVDNITFTNSSADQATTVSGIYRAITSGVTVTGTISGATIQGTIVSGATVTGTTANFTSGIFAAGSAAAPSISFVGDSNTGIYSPGADTLAFTKGGAEALRIDSNGRVGIGTSSPASSLSIGNTSSVSTATPEAIDIGGTYSNTAGANLKLRLYWGEVGASGAYGLGVSSAQLDYVIAGSGSHVFFSNATERVRIDSSGRLGIGTASPAYRLDVQGGNARIYAGGVGSSLEIGTGATGNQYAFLDLIGDTTYGDYGLRLIRDNTGSNAISRLTHRGTGTLVISTEDLGAVVIATNSSERMQVASNGNVGIGVSGPAQNLHVYNATTTVTTRIQCGSQFLDLAHTGSDAYITNTLGATVFYTGGSEKARVDSSGNVGIGTSVPGGLLEVSKAASGTLNGEVLLQRIRSNASNAFFLDIKSRRHTAGSDWFGVGLRLQHQVDSTLMGFLEFNSTNNAQDVALGTSSAYPIVFKVNNTENARFDSSGRLGIGTSFPTVALTVANGAISAGALIPAADIAFPSAYANGFFRAVGSYQAGGGVGGTIQLGGKSYTDSGNVGAFLISAVSSSNATDALTFSTQTSFNNVITERMRIDSSGNVGIGTSTPGHKLDVAGGVNSTGLNATGVGGFFNGASKFGVDNNAGTTRMYSSGPDASTRGSFDFRTTDSVGTLDTSRMVIDSSGRLLIGTSTAIEQGLVLISYNGGVNQGTIFADSSTASGNNAIRFKVAGTTVGSITTTSSATAYNTSSDYRLKENIEPVTDGITRLQQLNPSRFNFIVDPDRTVDGFIAHEVQDIVPEAITGEKDAEDDDGNPIYQGIDQSKLVPLLTAALQEAIAKIETLEARLTAAGIA